MKKILDLPPTDRPREKLTTSGATALSDLELLQVLLGSGSKKIDVRSLASKVLKIINDRNGSLTCENLIEISGMGPAKAAIICAAIEFSRRRIRPEAEKIGSAVDVFPLVRHYALQKQEHFICITLNGAHEVIKTRVITVGLVNSTQIHPREVFADAITDRATAIIVAHNHPSGKLTPSSEDLKTTRSIVEAGKLLGIKVLDHVIFGRDGFLSLQETGQM